MEPIRITVAGCTTSSAGLRSLDVAAGRNCDRQGMRRRRLRPVAGRVSRSRARGRGRCLLVGVHRARDAGTVTGRVIPGRRHAGGTASSPDCLGWLARAPSVRSARHRRTQDAQGGDGPNLSPLPHRRESTRAASTSRPGCRCAGLDVAATALGGRVARGRVAEVGRVAEADRAESGAERSDAVAGSSGLTLEGGRAVGHGALLLGRKCFGNGEQCGDYRSVPAAGGGGPWAPTTQARRRDVHDRSLRLAPQCGAVPGAGCLRFDQHGPYRCLRHAVPRRQRERNPHRQRGPDGQRLCW